VYQDPLVDPYRYQWLHV